MSVPRRTRDALLREFNHRCAICGADNPHIHHIDEDPSNNTSGNLLPLCPNCHVLDQHNPTAPVEPLKLGLFRKYKDPTILGPQFEPLFRRLAHLVTVTPESDADEQLSLSQELVSFVSALKMGDFYHTRLFSLIAIPSQSWFTVESNPRQQTLLRQQYCAQLLRNRDKAIDLIVEMLRYQDWPAPTRRHRS